jgi:opacity protein-like surface antigen
VKLHAFAATTLVSLALAAPAAAVESPPSGIPPSQFATQYNGCLGSLRSQIAQGDFAGVGPFGEHFTGTVNPGAHQGTVGEQEFLQDVIGVPEASLSGFCGQFG